MIMNKKQTVYLFNKSHSSLIELHFYESRAISISFNTFAIMHGRCSINIYEYDNTHKFNLHPEQCQKTKILK